MTSYNRWIEAKVKVENDGQVAENVKKHGRTTNADNGVATDIWNHDSQPIWVAPTQARIHAIASDNANDTSAGTGAQTVRVFGLTDWSTAEVNEDITMNGVTGVNTVNSYVIIHRLEVLAWGSGAGPNIGTITATAATDSTVTARIEPTYGRTQMCIYGIPSGKTLWVRSYQAGIVKAASSTNAEVQILYNGRPDSELTNFVVREDFGLDTTGTSERPFVIDDEPLEFIGPGIIKIQVNASSNNTIVHGTFGGILTDT